MQESTAFHKLVAAAVPSATIVRTSIETETDAHQGTTTLYKALVNGPGFAAAVRTQSDSAAGCAANLKTPVREARREHDVRQVLFECGKLANGNLSETELGCLEYDLRKCYYADFQKVAATCRKTAQLFAERQAA